MKEGTIKKILISNDLDRFKEEELNALYNDFLMQKYLNELNINVELVNEYLDIFLDINDDLHYCTSCPGIEKCKKKNPYLLIKPEIDGKYIERKMVFCPKMIQKRELENKFIVRDFYNEWVGKSMYNKADFDISEIRKPLIIKCRDLLKSESKEWLYLYGPSRLGKSYIVTLLIQDLLKKNEGAKCAFLDSPTRIKELNDLSFTNKEEFNELLKKYMNVDYLVLDDFGNEYKNEYIRDTIIYPLLSCRAKENKPVYFTSHYSIKDLVSLYGITSLGKIKSQSLGDLIKIMSKKEIHLEGVKIY